MIRDARPDDCAAIAALWNPVIRDTAITFTTLEKTGASLQQTLAEKAAAGFPFLVAEVAGAVAGFATYGSFRNGPGYVRTAEHTIILGPQARGRGIGRGLMAALEQRARAAGIHSLIAGVSGENPEGRAFHAAVGFAEIAVLPEVGYKFGRYMDLVLMQKRLA
jgi:phosphinothricin acetyltransferase